MMRDFPGDPPLLALITIIAIEVMEWLRVQVAVTVKYTLLFLASG